LGGDGDLTVTMAGGQTVTLSGVVAGTIYPLRCSQVRSTGTTATRLVSLF
jgi:hypothetical protein